MSKIKSLIRAETQETCLSKTKISVRLLQTALRLDGSTINPGLAGLILKRSLLEKGERSFLVFILEFGQMNNLNISTRLTIPIVNNGYLIWGS